MIFNEGVNMTKATKQKSVFETLSVIDVGEHTEKKGKFTYLGHGRGIRLWLYIQI